MTVGTCLVSTVLLERQAEEGLRQAGRANQSYQDQGSQQIVFLPLGINSCISNRMYVSVTVGRKDPAVEFTWRYL